MLTLGRLECAALGMVVDVVVNGLAGHQGGFRELIGPHLLNIVSDYFI
jgi:hypothetical protein